MLNLFEVTTSSGISSFSGRLKFAGEAYSLSSENILVGGYLGAPLGPPPAPPAPEKSIPPSPRAV